MASLTAGAEVSTVRVTVTLEATMTSHRESPIQRRHWNLLPVGHAQRPSPCGVRLVAQGACCFRVGSRPLEFRHAIVVELWCPLLGTVALGTVLAQLAAVLVVLLVAVEAAVLAQLVLVLVMT